MERYGGILFVVALLTLWIGGAILSAIVGPERKLTFRGVLEGIVFGPLAVVVLNGRSKCPACGAKIEKDAQICGRCRAEIRWKGHRPYRPQDNEIADKGAA